MVNTDLLCSGMVYKSTGHSLRLMCIQRSLVLVPRSANGAVIARPNKVVKKKTVGPMTKRLMDQTT